MIDFLLLYITSVCDIIGPAMSELDVILGILASFGVFIGLVVVPVLILKGWDRYVRRKGISVNSGAKFG